MKEDQLKKYIAKMPLGDIVDLCALSARCAYVDHVAYMSKVFMRLGEETSDKSRELLRQNDFVGADKLFRKGQRYYDLAIEVLKNDPA